MERVDLVWEYGKRPVSRWRSHGSASSQCRFVDLGQLADGRWYAHLTGDGDAYVFDSEGGEQLAVRLAERWMAGHEWIPTPACYDGWAQPADGRSWVARGNEWWPA